MQEAMASQRVAELEKRVKALEELAQRALWFEKQARKDKEEELVRAYGDYVDKTMASKILGVTRATVYTMLSDGRIAGACGGRRVDVRSIAQYLVCPRGETRTHHMAQ